MYIANKKSPRYYATHFQDKYTDLGFDYSGKIFKKTMSSVIFANENNNKILNKLEPMVMYLIECVKQIKLQYMISLDKNDSNLN